MKWQLKILLNGAKASAPFRDHMRKVSRHLFGYSAVEGNLRSALSDGIKLIQLLRETSRDIPGKRILEIGSGWFPVVPILYSILGAREVILTDLSPHMDQDTFRIALDFMHRNKNMIAQPLSLPSAQIDAALAQAASPGDLRLSYRAPFSSHDLGSNSIDLISSRAVLEHIPTEAFEALLPEWIRLLTRDGVMAHAIDMSDHFEHTDKTISRINFLRYSPSVWRLLSVGATQNRLRHSEFIALFTRAGLTIEAVETKVDEPTIAAAKSLNLAAPFDRMDPDDIAILTSYVILLPNARAHSQSGERRAS